MKRKRFIALILAIVMTIGMFPVYTSAEEGASAAPTVPGETVPVTTAASETVPATTAAPSVIQETTRDHHSACDHGTCHGTCCCSHYCAGGNQCACGQLPLL